MPTKINPILMSLIQQSRSIDPSISDAFILIANEFDRISGIIDPAPVVAKKIAKVSLPAPLDVLDLTYVINLDNITLSWNAPEVGFLLYEIRQGLLDDSFATWDTASRLLVTGSLSAIINPLLVGTTTFFIKAINANGVYSAAADSVDVIITGILPFSVTSSVLGNFVLIDWLDPITNFTIDYYIITRDSVVVARKVFNSFYSIQEVAGGIYTYGVTAVDIAGNESAEIFVQATVGPPADFDFINSIMSTLNGTIVNGVLDNGSLFVNIDTITTYEDHFINNGWASPQEQVDAGYPLWIQPTELTGSYEETFDFLTIFQNVTVNLSYLFNVLSGMFTFGLDIRVSDDDITYSSPYLSAAFSVPSVRYVKALFTFTSGDTLGLMTFSDLICTLNIRRANDGGTVDVFAADQPTGTLVTFNKSFAFVESITVSALDSVQKTAIYDFAGGFNPTSFYILTFDAAGNPCDATVSWAARGVI